MLVEVEKWLKRVLRSTDFDVEDVELKGTPLTVQWGARRGEAKAVTFGSLAKMPRDWRRFAEWQSTTRMTAHELRKLPERFPVAGSREPEPEAEVACPQGRQGVGLGEAGRSRGHPQAGAARQGAAASADAPEVGRSSRAVVVAEDVQMALAVIRACTLHPNPDGSMPLMRVKAIWDAAYEAGDTTRAFSFHRFPAIRNMLSDMGLLEWEDATYRFGRACRWRASEELMGMMEEALSSSTTTTPSLLDHR